MGGALVSVHSHSVLLQAVSVSRWSFRGVSIPACLLITLSGFPAIHTVCKVNFPVAFFTKSYPASIFMRPYDKVGQFFLIAFDRKPRIIS